MLLCSGTINILGARSSTDRATGFYPVGWGFDPSGRAIHEANRQNSHPFRRSVCTLYANWMGLLPLEAVSHS